MLKLNQQIQISNDLIEMDIFRVEKKLNSVNWDFPQRLSYFQNEPRPFNCRKFHWFPATFIPEIPFTLIEILTNPGAVVVDPFSGVGTTFFQALLLGRRPLAMEVCNVAIEFSKGLFTLFDPTINQSLILKKILSKLGAYEATHDYTKEVKNILIDKLKPWYASKTLNQLAFLFNIEQQFSDIHCLAGIRVTLSSILRTVSSQDRGWGCVADNVLPKPHQLKEKDVLGTFTRSLKFLLTSIASHLNYVTANFTNVYKEIKNNQVIICGDARQESIITESSVDLVVTSPPYLNMVDYVTSQRLSYYYMGFDLSMDATLEIGARHKRRKINAIEQYRSDMKIINKNIASMLKHHGYACYVMPSFCEDNDNNIKRKAIIDELIKNMSSFGLEKIGEFDRVVSNRRRDHNLKWATLEKEKIYIFIRMD